MLEIKNKKSGAEVIYLNSFLIDGKVMLLVINKHTKEIILVPKENYEWNV